MSRTLTLALIFVLALCAQAPAQSRQGALVYGRSADASFLDPALFLDNESAKVIENIFDGLVRYRDDSTLIEPALATSWTVSPDGLAFTFTLRKGVLFHDGTPFNAQAAQFSLQRKIDPTHPFHLAKYGKMDTTLKSVKRVEALDDTHLRITLKERYAPFLDELARHSSFIVSPTAVRANPEGFNKHPVGTGPFVFESWIPGDRIILRANPRYFGGAPQIGSVVFKVVPNGQVRLLELKTGAIHAMDALDPDDKDEVRRTPGLALDAMPGLNVGYLAMNGDHPPLDNPKVRRAIAHAINQPALLKLVYKGMAAPAASLLPPGMWGHNPKVSDYDYNPALAKKLLRQAGLSGGLEVTLWTTPTGRPYMPDPEKMARLIQENLAAVGIRARIISHDWKTYLAKLYNGEHDLALLGWVSTGDPSDILNHLLDADNAEKPHASNISFFRDQAVHELLTQAERETNMNKRLELYAKAQERTHELAPLVPLAHANLMLARSAKALGIVNHQTGFVRFSKARLQ